MSLWVWMFSSAAVTEIARGRKSSIGMLVCNALPLRPTGLPVRQLPDYIEAMRQYHRRRAGKPTAGDPLAEDWMGAFAIIEPGAMVDPRAHLHDSVVLRGGLIEPGAVAVRSIICPGGVVRKDRHAVDQLVCHEQQPA